MHTFRVSPGLASVTDERPVVQVVVDISEPIAMLTAGLCDISPNQLVDDSTIQYIGSLLVESVASPFPSGRSVNQINAFFHPQLRDQINELTGQVKEIIGDEIRSAEKASESLLHQPIYPAKDISTIMSRRGNLLSLSYRLGKEDIPAEADDPYIGYDPAVRAVEEEADEEVTDSIVHID